MICKPDNSELDFIAACAPDDPEDFLQKCTRYGELLYQTNETLNLTRIPPEEFWSKHVCDSLAIARYVPLQTGKICDTGCGAGLPSIILAAAFPRLNVTAIDSTGKKIVFVADAAQKTGLKNLTAIHGRANELGRKKEFHRVFPLVTARAVGSAETLLRETSNFIAPGGKLVIYRTIPQLEEELDFLKARKINFSATEPLELPSQAGTRLFLSIRPPKNSK